MYLPGGIRFVDGVERVDIAIDAGKLRELLARVPDATKVRVNPITQNLMLDTGQWIDIAEEELAAGWPISS